LEPLRLRILFADLMTYKEEMDAQCHKILDELTKQAQKLVMGYRRR